MIQSLNELQTSIKNLPTQPGVYRMLSSEGTVLYVGKARDLKKRVSSYFNKNSTSSKTRSLVQQIVSIEVHITRSETEALLLESSLIKTHRPKYNVLMRDDKSYPYIYVNTNHDYPRFEMIRTKKKPPKGLYFGPYPNVGAVRDTLALIQKIFKVRNCRDSYFKARSRPCLQYQIKRCAAPCTAYISETEYQQCIQDAILFLQGKSPAVLENLSLRMDTAAKDLDFEEAAYIRDQIKSLRAVLESQSVVQAEGELDVIVLKAYPGFACVLCVTVRAGQVVQSESFFPEVPQDMLDDDTDLPQQVFDAFIAFYYVDKPERIPETLVVDAEIADKAQLAATGILLTELRKKRCQIQTEVRSKKKEWLDFARNNLGLALAEFEASDVRMKQRYQALAQLLGLEQPIQRMECFDISHTQGTSTVASCVVFGDRGPLKKDYRQFNIAGITPGDDYAAMEQALGRRYRRLMEEQAALPDKKILPDVLIIDGGKGQISVAKRVLASLDVKNVGLLGIAKGPGRKAGWEHLVYKDQAFRVPDDSEALHLLQWIRDEAHRFAITKHRNKRQKASFSSALDDIEGIGSKRRQALLRHFGGKQALAKASAREIAKVNGISEKLAYSIYSHFHLEHLSAGQ